jgi:hypothetical protein
MREGTSGRFGCYRSVLEAFLMVHRKLMYCMLARLNLALFLSSAKLFVKRGAECTHGGKVHAWR